MLYITIAINLLKNPLSILDPEFVSNPIIIIKLASYHLIIVIDNNTYHPCILTDKFNNFLSFGMFKHYGQNRNHVSYDVICAIYTSVN